MADSRIDELRRRLDREPESRLFAQLAEELRKVGELEEAISVARKGLVQHPAYPSARLTLGRALLDSGDPATARAELEVAVRGAPDNILANRLLGEALEALGDLDGALAQYQKTVQLAPGERNVEARMEGIRQRAVGGAPFGEEETTTAPGGPPPLSGAAGAGEDGEAPAPTIRLPGPSGSPAGPHPPAAERAPGGVPPVLPDVARAERPRDRGPAGEPLPDPGAAATPGSTPGVPPPVAERRRAGAGEGSSSPPRPVREGAAAAGEAEAASPGRPGAQGGTSRPLGTPPGIQDRPPGQPSWGDARTSDLDLAPTLPPTEPAPSAWPPRAPSQGLARAPASASQPEAVAQPDVPAGGAAAPRDAPLLSTDGGPPTEVPAATPFSSPTLAELYLQQGLMERAVEVYRQLVLEEPGNERARRRLVEVEALVAAGASDLPGAAEGGDERAVRRRALERTIERLESLLAVVRRR